MQTYDKANYNKNLDGEEDNWWVNELKDATKAYIN
jgi:hypothetical protein